MTASAFHRAESDPARLLLLLPLLPLLFWLCCQVVIFDSQLVVKHAFDGMVHHDLTCAPVWDSWKKKYVGLLSVSDFLDILSTD